MVWLGLCGGESVPACRVIAGVERVPCGEKFCVKVLELVL